MYIIEGYLLLKKKIIFCSLKINFDSLESIMSQKREVKKKMKKLVIVMAMVIFLMTGTAMAEITGSGAWIGGNVYGGAFVFGQGEAYTDGVLFGSASSYSGTGGTYSSVFSGIHGEVYAKNGAGLVFGHAGGYAEGFQGNGYSFSYATSQASSYAVTMGNASAFMHSSADAWSGSGAFLGSNPK